MERMSDCRDLHGARAKASRAAGTAPSQIAKIGKAASTSVITGFAASAAAKLGANGQQMDQLVPSSDSTDSDIRHFAYILTWNHGGHVYPTLHSN